MGLAGIGMLSTSPGIMMISFVDGHLEGFPGMAERPANYQMFIQVERIP